MDERRRKIVLSITALVLFSLAAYFFIAVSPGREKFPTEYTIDGVCLSCKAESRVAYGREDYAPFECPKCKAKAVFGWMFCSDCKKRFVPELDRSDPSGAHLPAHIVCKNCKSGYVQQYIPGTIIQKPTGDAPLPKWP